MQLDNHNGNNLWWIAWDKKMKNVQVDFDVKDKGDIAPVVYQETGCHMIFDIKATTLAREVRFVSGKHTLNTPAVRAYELVVLQESF